MLKRDELSNLDSCLSKAKDDEMVFVLLGRDPSAPITIRMWIEDRIMRKLNRPDDEKIVSAERIRMQMRDAQGIPRDDRADAMVALGYWNVWASTQFMVLPESPEGQQIERLKAIINAPQDV